MSLSSEVSSITLTSLDFLGRQSLLRPDSKIADIQLELSKFIESVNLFDPESMIVAHRKAQGFGNYISIVDAYNESGMKSEIRRVTDSIDALNEDIKDLNPITLL